MISTIVLEAYNSKAPPDYHGDHFSATRISPCSYATYLNFSAAKELRPEDTGQDRLRMKNGNWQEKEILEDLLFAGFELQYTGKQQQKVFVGKAQAPGRPDGQIKMESWDGLEIKAVDERRYSRLRRRGLDVEPYIRCQVQLYMASDKYREAGINRTWVYVKHKDSCLPYDILEEYNEDYARPIIEAADLIVLEGWIPTPEENSLCEDMCQYRKHCWENRQWPGAPEVVASADVVDAAAKWKEGERLRKLAFDLQKQPKEILRGLVPEEEDTVMVEGLRVHRYTEHRTGIDKDKFIRVFGPRALVDVLTESQTEKYRITEVKEKDKEEDG